MIAVGLGLRREHYPFLLENRPRVAGWFEAISENYMDSEGRPMAVLEHVRRDFPVALHGVSLSIGAVEPPSMLYLQRLRNLTQRIDPFLVSDHFSWGRARAEYLHDLLPLPFCEESIACVSRNLDIVQEYLGRSIALENVSSYLTYTSSTLSEWEFISEVVRRSGCRLLLDVNNIYVNAKNHGFSAKTFIESIPNESVAEIHIAGHSDRGTHLFDTHSTAVCDDVWNLLRCAVARMPRVPVLLERDEDIPSFPELEQELERAQTECREAIEQDSILEVTKT
ncbi:MAG: DUF692 domain-containing protein [Leptospirales bacterium]|nr:DUF692 domain-containing protein [Leptospirales bacterium]